MAALRKLATAAAVAAAMVSAAPARARAGEADNAYLIVFSGTNLSRYGGFLYGGTLWSPAGINAGQGFTLKTLLSGGNYDYFSGGLAQQVNGTMASAAVLPGWRFTRNHLTIGLYAGPLVQDYRLTPNDPGSRLHGLYAGAQFAADLWYQPDDATMASLSGAIGSIGPTGYLRAAFGLRRFAGAFVGPEMQENWCGDYQEFEFGMHVTGLHIDGLEWSAGGGWSVTSDRRSSPYLHLDMNARY